MLGKIRDTIRRMFGLQEGDGSQQKRHVVSHRPFSPETERQVRMTSVYPRQRKTKTAETYPAEKASNNKEGNFRFPLVDEKEIERSRNQGRHKRTDGETTSASAGQKRPFQPSDVPSPVFGSRKRTVDRWSAGKEREDHSPIDDPFRDQTEQRDANESVEKADEKPESAPALAQETSSVSSLPDREGEKRMDDLTEDGPKPDSSVVGPVKEEVKPEPRVVPRTQQRVEPLRIVRGTGYRLPGANLLDPVPLRKEADRVWLDEKKEQLSATLENFHVKAKVVGVTKGPSVTRFEIQPEPGVKVNKITNLADDIKLSLAAKDIRMEAPIPGRAAVGIEVPNAEREPVHIRSLIESRAFVEQRSRLAAVLGLDIEGNPVVTDIKKMPHGLIAGATGSGKSVCMNAMIISLLYRATPSEVRLMLIDPKTVELAPYQDIPHLLTPVVTDVKQATQALKWAVEEMERRYQLFAQSGARDIERYNQLMAAELEGDDPALPYIVIIVDELADLMMTAPSDVEEAICRIAQKARACGIHLLLATQRPSVDVITGLIKANIPTRLAFAVSSQVDSRTILDVNGAEKLLGRGDMLFLDNGEAKPVRLQGVFVTDDEIERVTSFVKEQARPNYLFDKEELVKRSDNDQGEEDELFMDALQFVIEQGQASASAIQRRFRVGFNRAARLVEQMEERGYVSGQSGSKPREVLVTKAELEEREG